MDLLQKFKPILYLHNKELTTPMNLDEQISKSELCVGGKLKEIKTRKCFQKEYKEYEPSLN